jgi:hypothetical protein
MPPERQAPRLKPRSLSPEVVDVDAEEDEDENEFNGYDDDEGMYSD